MLRLLRSRLALDHISTIATRARFALCDGYHSLRMGALVDVGIGESSTMVWRATFHRQRCRFSYHARTCWFVVLHQQTRGCRMLDLPWDGQVGSRRLMASPKVPSPIWITNRSRF